jgi:Flp pilus assembly protein TadB
MEHARYAAEAEEARERRAAADRAARLALAAEEEARRQAAAERTRRLAAEDAARAAAEGAQPPQRIDHDPTTRLTAAVIRLQTSADATATRVERLTWALVGLGLVVAVLAVVLALKS